MGFIVRLHVISSVDCYTVSLSEVKALCAIRNTKQDILFRISVYHIL